MAPDSEIPRRLDRVLERALAPAPAGRFDSVADLRGALENLIDERARSRTRRRRAGAAMVGLVTFAAVAVVGARFSHAVPDGLVAAVAVGRELVGQAIGVSLPGTSAAPAAEVQAAKVQPPPAAALEAASPAEAAPAPVPTFAEDTEAQAELVAQAAAEPAPSNEPAEATPEAAEGVAVTDSGAAKVLAEFEELQKDSRPLKALHLIRAAAKEFPKEPAVLRAYAKAAEDTKAWGEARRAATRWVKVDPTAEARLSLARLERATGNTQKALALVQGVLAEDASSEEARRLGAAWSHEQRFALNR